MTFYRFVKFLGIPNTITKVIEIDIFMNLSDELTSEKMDIILIVKKRDSPSEVEITEGWIKDQSENYSRFRKIGNRINQIIDN